MPELYFVLIIPGLCLLAVLVAAAVEGYRLARRLARRSRKDSL